MSSPVSGSISLKAWGVRHSLAGTEDAGGHLLRGESKRGWGVLRNRITGTVDI